MITRRRLLIAFGIGALAAPFASFAQQQPAKVARIGFLGALSASGIASRVEALRAGLRDLGYVEGKNIIIEYRWAEGKYDRLPDLAAELVRLKVDILVTYGTPGTLAAKRATTTIPIVMATSGDAVGTGLVASLARPGGNITGSSFFSPELMAKRLALLKEAMPRITRVAVLLNPDNPAIGQELQAMETTARSLKVDLQPFEVRGPNEFDGALARMANRRIDAVVIEEDSMLVANARAIADLAAKQRLPSTGFLEFAEAGGLMAYGVNLPELFRRAATFVDTHWSAGVKGQQQHFSQDVLRVSTALYHLHVLQVRSPRPFSHCVGCEPNRTRHPSGSSFRDTLRAPWRRLPPQRNVGAKPRPMS